MTDVACSAPDPQWLYHFTHLDNLEGILRAGRLSCDSRARQGMTRTEVGATDIKDSRRRRRIPIPPGGFVGDFVPFYFAPRSPMMYRIACEHRDGVPDRYPGGDRPLVYLITTAAAVIADGLTWIATDGNAATATTEFTSDLSVMLGAVDWALMQAERWNNTSEDMDRQRRRQAEFLVHDSVPVAVVHRVGVISEAYRSRVGKILGDHELGQRIIVRPSWYYGFERR